MNTMKTMLAGVVLASYSAVAQPGELRGTITDAATGMPMPYANVAILAGDLIVTGGTTDSGGHYRIKPVEPGTYSVQGSFVGYSAKAVGGVVIRTGHITFLDLSLANDITLPPVVVEEYREPLFEKDEPRVMFTLDAEKIENSATADPVDLAAQAPGVVQVEEGGRLYIRGSRDNATQYIVDGMRIRGDLALPKKSIARIEVITGGVPAQFGDATGGIVIITTKSFPGRR